MKRTLTLLIGSLLFVAGYILAHKQVAYLSDQETSPKSAFVEKPTVNSIRAYPIFAVKLNSSSSLSKAN